MSGASTTTTTARFLTADYLVQGRDNDISCPLWLGAALVAPSAGGTVSIYDASNTAIVSAAVITVTANIATYTVLAASLPSTLARGMGWRIEWTLTVSGKPKVYRNAAGLVKAELAPVVADGDLFRRERGLDPDGTAPICTLTDYQSFRDEAWVIIIGWLTAKGNLPHLIMEPAALREWHITLTLHLIFQDFRTRLNETWKEKSDDYRGQAKEARDGLAFEYDTTDSGISDGRRKRGANPTVFLGGFD